MKSGRYLRIVLALGTGVVVLILAAPRRGAAVSAGELAEQNLISSQQSEAASTGSAPASRSVATPIEDRGVLSLNGSSVATSGCYTNTSQVLCFTIYNGSTDAEWITHTRLTFPTGGSTPWAVSCHSQDPADSSGSPVNMTCSNSSGHELIYHDNDDEGPNIGEITANSSWSVCVNVTNVPSDYDGDRLIHWGLYGDGDGAPPHEVTGTLTIEHCDALMLKPSSIELEGCNGITQTVDFELWNHAAGTATFNLTYDVTSGNGSFSGPSGFSMSTGEVVTFTAQFAPDACVSVGEKMTATLTVNGNGETDSTTLVNATCALQGWQAQTSSPIPAMDNVVVWASEQDGRLWSIGGYGSGRVAQAYDPGTGNWTTYGADISPTIEYPMDGCYGLNGAGHEVIVLFPDTIVTGSLHIFDITSQSWYTAPVPVGYYDEGRWGYDVVSLLNVPGVNQNACYLSGGSTQQGGGRTKNLHVYYPATKTAIYLGNFPAAHVFGFHASWYVPWVGTQGAICVAGGTDHNQQMPTASQCYDLGSSSFRPANADLGPLPQAWWGMADGWQVYRGRYQIWMANGVSQNGMLLPASLYADATTGGFVYGPAMPVPLYRTEGDGYAGSFYVIGGAAGGFNYSDHNQLLVQCPWCATVDLPVVLKNY
jgi:hypothetical protein